MKSPHAAARRFKKELYHQAIAERLMALMADETNVDSDGDLARRLTKGGCPCCAATVQDVRQEQNIPNKWQRMRALTEAAQKWVASQPIEGLS